MSYGLGTPTAPVPAAANEKTLYDYMSAGVDVNLKMGTPGKTLLCRSNELMKKAALHRLVLFLFRHKALKYS